MWSISNIDNTVALTKEQAIELMNQKTYTKFMGGYYVDADNPTENDLLEYYFDLYEGKYYLMFLSDHMEHMDYVWKIEKELKKLKVQGDITFSSLDGDNAGTSWGYRFDGNGGMKKLKGVLTFVEV